MRCTGAKITRLREGLGLSTAQLAKLIVPRVTRQSIELWEKDGVGTFRTLNRIAAALGVAPELLLD